MQAKPGCYCERCDKYVAAQKTTHHLRNSVAALALLPTLGISALLFHKEHWHCPLCGGPIRDLQAEAMPAPSIPLLLGILVIMLIIVSILS